MKRPTRTALSGAPNAPERAGWRRWATGQAVAHVARRVRFLADRSDRLTIVLTVAKS